MILGGIGEWTAGLVHVFDGQPTLFLFACVAAFLIIGLALDAGPALILLTPFLLPIARKMGIEDIHFSMIMIVCTTMGLISPPVGICLFVACRIGNMSLRTLMTELWPLLFAETIVVVLMVFFPILSNGMPIWILHSGG
jgi:TRAP-type C4-dicarboxylate transport system permease large subunit